METLLTNSRTSRGTQDGGVYEEGLKFLPHQYKHMEIYKFSLCKMTRWDDIPPPSSTGLSVNLVTGPDEDPSLFWRHVVTPPTRFITDI